ncbi:NADH dehydrogenase [Anoxybacter fermentans]|uniref:NADH dehydrogenase n=1 Tax=Anoxybacter fermentans TaxID=1323375 RepID=A0A3Q9HQ44_9FIRM|nr:nitroreductase family protein [Anoxybacter fermentans]AZR73016.1 NADH dehydrogenase [Anoxybacter fermentans]
MTKDLIDAIQRRRSVRKFKPDPIPDPTIGRILDCGRMAPSAGNIEPWFFYVVKNNDIKHKLAQCSESWIENAPVLIVVVADYDQVMKRYGERGRDLYVLQDTAAATQNMLLAAHGYGIGSCWVGDFDDQKVKQILQIPEEQKPVAIIPLGYPVENEERPAVHKTLSEVVKIIH